MKVLFHCYDFPPEAGGVGAYLYQMATALCEAGHGAVVVTGAPPSRPAVEDRECGRVYRAYARHEIGSRRVRDLVLALAREHQVDWIEGADHLGECASLLNIRRRPPILIKYHGCHAMRPVWSSQIYYPWQRLTIQLSLLRVAGQVWRERRSIERADFACAPAAPLLAELQAQRFRLPARLAVVPNPMRLERPAAGEEAPRPTLLFVGRVDIRKGIQYLPDLLRRVRVRHPDAALEIVGPDSYARGVGSLTAWLRRQLGAELRRVSFLGCLTGPALDAAYRRAWVFVLPSRWDNFPTVILEAMARGKAIVASPHGGMPEMLADTGCAIADPARPEFASRVAELLEQPERRRAAGASARRKVDQAYAPSAIVARYLDFVKACL